MNRTNLSPHNLTLTNFSFEIQRISSENSWSFSGKGSKKLYIYFLIPPSFPPISHEMLSFTMFTFSSNVNEKREEVIEKVIGKIIYLFIYLSIYLFIYLFIYLKSTISKNN